MQMPSFFGVFKVTTNTGTLNNGDNLITAPTTSIKTNEGSGSAVTGDFPTTISIFSITLVIDPDIIDGSPTKVATGT
jgi:hypothetical protein